MRMQHKKALVTGSSRGIGRAIALAFASEGASIVVHYASRRDRAEEVVRAVREQGGTALAIQADLAVPQEAEQLLDQALQHLGGLDVLVNNAGVLDPIQPGDVGLTAFRHTLDVNLTATHILSQRAAPALRAAGGCVINISSIAGLAGYPYANHYAAAKAGIVAITQSMALELAPHVRVNAIAPGYTNTGDPNGWSEERIPVLAQMTPLQRYGRPEDVARAAVFLAAEASFVTGITLTVDGGLSLRLPGYACGS